MVQMGGEGLVVHSILKSVNLYRKNLLLSLEDEAEQGSVHFLLRFFTLGKYRMISDSS